MKFYAEKTPIIETHQFAQCAHCDFNLGCIDNLINKISFETCWYCDKCGKQTDLKFSNGKLETRQFEGLARKEIAVFLKCGKVGLIVRGADYGRGYDNIIYYYNEHTCPTNYITNVVKILDLENFDTDPHGIFEFVSAVPWDDKFDSDNLLELSELKQNFKL